MRKIIGSTLIAAATLSSTQAFAISKNIYTCTLRVLNSNGDMVIEQSFSADESNGSHGGGASQVFSSMDKRTQVAISADARWMMLNWTYDGKTVANAAFVVNNPSVDYRVSVVYNPNNIEEQASLACDPNFKL